MVIAFCSQSPCGCDLREGGLAGVGSRGGESTCDSGVFKVLLMFFRLVQVLLLLQLMTVLVSVGGRVRGRRSDPRTPRR